MNLATDPIERLGQLIADESLLDTKIHDTQTALTLIKKRVSESLARAARAREREIGSMAARFSPSRADAFPRKHLACLLRG